MPSGPKKRKSAKKKKELEETLRNAPDIQEKCSNLEGKFESITETKKDSGLKTVERDLPAPVDVIQIDEEEDCSDSKENILPEDLVPDDCIAVSEEMPETDIEVEIPKMVIQREEEAFLSENSQSMGQLESFKRTLFQELQGIMEQVEHVKGTFIQGLQAIEKLKAVLHRIEDDLNNFQRLGGE